MSFNQLIIKQDESISYQFSEADFDLSRWDSSRGAVPLSGGRGASLKIAIQDDLYVLRKYLRGGFMARLLNDRYLWTGLTRSRPFQEQRVIRHAQANTLPVPAVAGYRIQQQGLFYRAAIISRYIPNEGTLASFLYQNKLPNDLWLELGRLIKRLHRVKIFHADLNANNILMGKAGEFYLIDFDKARIMDSTGDWGAHNLQRLLRSLNKIQGLRHQQREAFNFSAENWQLLLQGYR